jgi:hypothetical protein
VTVRAWFRVWRAAEHARWLTLPAEDMWRENYTAHPAWRAFDRRAHEEREHDVHWAWLMRRQARGRGAIQLDVQDLGAEVGAEILKRFHGDGDHAHRVRLRGRR